MGVPGAVLGALLLTYLVTMEVNTIHMARTFKSTDVSVLYRYMGDSIPLCKLPAFQPTYLLDGGENGRVMSKVELGLRIRVDSQVIKAVAEKTGITARIVSVTPGIMPDGTGYFYVEYDGTADMTKFTKPYAEQQGRNKRLSNIATAYWTIEDQKATGLQVMPLELCEELYKSITSIKAGYVSGKAAIARWSDTVTQANAAITALKTLGMAIPQELQAKANTPKPHISSTGKVTAK